MIGPQGAMVLGLDLSDRTYYNGIHAWRGALPVQVPL